MAAGGVGSLRPTMEERVGMSVTTAFSYLSAQGGDALC